MTYRVVGPRDKIPSGSLVFNVTSKSPDAGKMFSPMLLGPVQAPCGLLSQTVENAWQYSKVYRKHVGSDGLPNKEWYAWAKSGFDSKIAHRYPEGKGARPEYSWDGHRALSYIDARRNIYFNLYRDAVRNSTYWPKLLKYLSNYPGKLINIFDFDGYDSLKVDNNLSLILNDPSRIMGHGFVLLAMLLHGPDITPDEIDHIYAIPPCKSLEP